MDDEFFISFQSLKNKMERMFFSDLGELEQAYSNLKKPTRRTCTRFTMETYFI